MCLLKTLTKLICGAQVSFAAIKILIQEEAENTEFFTKTRKQGEGAEQTKFLL